MKGARARKARYECVAEVGREDAQAEEAHQELNETDQERERAGYARVLHLLLDTLVQLYRAIRAICLHGEIFACRFLDDGTAQQTHDSDCA